MAAGGATDAPPEDGAGAREQRLLWLRAALVVPVFGFAFFPVFRALVAAWLNRNDYSHGFVVPFICAYFIWESRAALRTVAVRPAWLSGALAVFSACLLLVLGEAAKVMAVQQVSLLVAVPGVVLLLLGWGFLKALALPIAYLSFMIPPLFDAFIGPLHWPFQLYSAAAASFLLQTIGVPVHHTGHLLELPGRTLEVARACSGIRFLVSIVALGVPLAFLTQRTIRRRVLLIAAAILIGVGLNPIRITLIGLWAQGGDGVLHGPFHILQGMFVSVVGFCLLFLLAWLFSEPGTGGPAREGAAPLQPAVPWRRFHLGLFAAVLLFGGTGAVMQADEPLPVPLATPLSAMPSVLGEWTAVPNLPGPGFTLAGADESVDRAYRDTSGALVRLQVGYYAAQRQGKEMVSYRLDELYEKARVVEFGEGRSRFAVNLAELASPKGGRVTLFWHHVGGRDVASTLVTKAMTARAWLFERRTNGAIVIVSSEVKAGQDSRNAIAKLAEFAALVRRAAELD